MNAIQTTIETHSAQPPGMLECQGTINLDEMARPKIQDVYDQETPDADAMHTGSKTPFDSRTAESVLGNWNNLSPERQQIHLKHREALADIIGDQDSRIAMIIGPCSNDNIDAAKRYLKEMAELQKLVAPWIKFVIRLYPEKPRSRNIDEHGFSWRGFAAHPNLIHRDNKIIDARGLTEFMTLYDEADRLGLATATEFLSMETVSHAGHLPDFIAVGARTVGEEKYTEMAKALGSIGTVVGFKNDTAGQDNRAIRSIQQVESANSSCTVVWRGGDNMQNWDRMDYSVEGRQGCVDTAHGNSGKRWERSIEILEAIVAKIRAGQSFPKLLMVESYIEDGNQPCPNTVGELEKMVVGKSITDECIGLGRTKAVVMKLAEALAA